MRNILQLTNFVESKYLRSTRELAKSNCEGERSEIAKSKTELRPAPRLRSASLQLSAVTFPP